MKHDLMHGNYDLYYRNDCQITQIQRVLGIQKYQGWNGNAEKGFLMQRYRMNVDWKIITELDCLIYSTEFDYFLGSNYLEVLYLRQKTYLEIINFVSSKKLFGGTVPLAKKLFGGTVPPSKKLFGGTVWKWHVRSSIWIKC